MRFLLLTTAVTFWKIVEAIALHPEWTGSDPALQKMVQVANSNLVSVPVSIGVEAATDKKRDDDSRKITKYLNDCQYRIMLKITSFFETSNPFLGFNVCTTTNDGQGISAGFIQFTTCSGSALQVCFEYQQLQTSTDNFCNNYISSLENAVSQYQSHCNLNTGRYTDPGLNNFCADWSNAAINDPLFSKAQEVVQKKGYFDAVANLFDQYQLKTPLAIALVYDTAIQSGTFGAPQIAQLATASAGGSPASGVDEGRWIGAFLTQRRQYLLNQGNAYADSVSRVDSFKSIWQSKNFDFHGGNGIEMNVEGGGSLSIDCS